MDCTILQLRNSLYRRFVLLFQLLLSSDYRSPALTIRCFMSAATFRSFS